MKIIIFVLTLLSTSAARGETVKEWLAKMDAALNNCREKAQSYADQRECNFRFAERVDKATDNVIRQIRLKLSERYAKNEDGIGWQAKEIDDRLVASQEAWRPYTTAQCKLRSTEALGGTDESGSMGRCLYAMAKQRLAEVATYLVR